MRGSTLTNSLRLSNLGSGERAHDERKGTKTQTPKRDLNFTRSFLLFTSLYPRRRYRWPLLAQGQKEARGRQEPLENTLASKDNVHYRMENFYERTSLLRLNFTFTVKNLPCRKCSLASPNRSERAPARAGLISKRDPSSRSSRRFRTGGGRPRSW